MTTNEPIYLKGLIEGYFNHGEAFMLMWYACSCGHREKIWNSRDGVTPFCLGCPSCGQLTLQHSRWFGDVRNESYKPWPGQRFFRDGTMDEAEVLVRSVADRMNLNEDEVTDLISSLHKEPDAHGFQEGWPAIERTPDL